MSGFVKYKVQIRKCGKGSYWYKNKIGHNFIVYNYDDNLYIVINSSKLINKKDTIQIFGEE